MLKYETFSYFFQSTCGYQLVSLKKLDLGRWHLRLGLWSLRTTIETVVKGLVIYTVTVYCGLGPKLRLVVKKVPSLARNQKFGSYMEL